MKRVLVRQAIKKMHYIERGDANGIENYIFPDNAR